MTDGHADAVALRSFLADVARRRRLRLIIGGVAAGIAAAVFATLLYAAGVGVTGAIGSMSWQVAAGVIAAGACCGALAGAVRSRAAEPPSALVERWSPASRNVVRTAAELVEGRIEVPDYVRQAVLARALDVAHDIAVARRLPIAQTAATLVLAAGSSVLLLALMASRPNAIPALVTGARPSPGIAAVDILVTPPSYTTQASRTMRDPERLQVLEGSMLSISAHVQAGSLVLETLDGRHAMQATDGRTFSMQVRAERDGFLSLEHVHADGRAGDRRMIALLVVEDSLPRVRITAPAADLRVADGRRTIDIEIEAGDDVGLASLVLSYTRVTGFGEQFTFLEGNVPLDVSRADTRRWTGRAAWPLDELGLSRGDVVVYRALARDGRPGAPAGESDTYVIEVVGGDAAGTGGLTGDEELDRYALSQQMIVVMTERLIARRDSLSPEERQHEAMTLAAAQRTVRAEFVFMLGGELEDLESVETGIMELHEEAHAAADAAVAAGGLASRGRADLARAIQSMSHVVTLLTGAELEEALDAGRTALIFLQRAFSSSRYIMRTLTEREQLDASRRLTGALDGAGQHSRPVAAADADPRIVELRGLLAGMVEAAAAARIDANTATRVTQLARAVARVDPSDETLQRVTQRLSEAAAAAADDRERNGTRVRQLVGQASLELAGYMRAQLETAPISSRTLEHQRLEGLITEALRAGG